MNLEKEARDLAKRFRDLSAMSGRWDDEPEALTREQRALEQELEQELELMDHLGDYHVVPILKWKISVGLERDRSLEKDGNNDYFGNYGEDYQNKTVEEEEYFRLMLKRDKAIGYDPKRDLQRKF